MTTLPTGHPVQVHLDRRKVDRLYAPLLALHVAVLMAAILFGMWAVISAGAPLFAVSPLVVLFIGQVVQISIVMSLWGGLKRTGVPLEIGPQGLVMRSAQGEVRSAWESVAWVVIERHLVGRRLRIRLVPEQDPRSAGIATDLKGRAAGIVRREGMRYSMRILRTDDQALARAFAEQSGGRVTLR